MPEKYAYKTDARKYPSRTGPDKKDDPQKKRRENPEKEEGSPERDHIDPPPRDTGEAPTPNPNSDQRNKKPA